MPRVYVNEIVNDLLRSSTTGFFTSADLAAATGTTRQAVHRHLSRLLARGVLIAEGHGRATRYRAGLAAPHHLGARDSHEPLFRFDRRFSIAGLSEDVTWQDVRSALPGLASAEATNAAEVMGYAFTEMLNNAIDHSGAPDVHVLVLEQQDAFVAEIRDTGVGVFENVRARLGLPGALDALQELSKGKVSTMPERHSGEGIFFTSKMTSQFEMAANGLVWIVDNARADHAIGEAATSAGTKVTLTIDKRTAHRPEEIFSRYTHDLVFDTTRAVVRLFEHGVRFVARSEAKRLVAGLERFAEVILDFRGVESVGQGFVDEIFRVWARAHPAIRIAPEGMNAPVAFMVERGRRAPDPRSA